MRSNHVLWLMFLGALACFVLLSTGSLLTGFPANALQDSGTNPVPSDYNRVVGPASKRLPASVIPDRPVPGAVGNRPPHTGSKPQLTLREEVIGEKSPEALSTAREYILLCKDVVSPDGKRVAWLDKRGQEWVVMVNGIPDGSAFDSVIALNFSPDSQHLAYWARRGKTWTVVIDQKERGVYSDIGYVIQFSADSAHHAYGGKRGKKSFIVSDSGEGPSFDQVAFPAFSPKDQRLVYAARRGKTWVIVDNGQEIPRESRSEFHGFTPGEEKRILVEEESGRSTKLRYVIGAEAGPWFDAISSRIAFGPSDDHFAYAGAKVRSGGLLHANDSEATGQIIVDGHVGHEYKSESIQTYAPNPGSLSGSRFLDYIESGLRSFSAGRYGVSAPVISPDGQHLAFAARLGNKHYAVMLDGQEVDSFESIPCNPAFSPDGGLYYAGFRSKKFVVVGSGTRLNEHVMPGKDDYDRYQCKVEFHPGKHFSVQLTWWGQKPGAGRRGLVFADGRPGREQVIGDEFRIQFVGNEFHTVSKVQEVGKDRRRSYIVLDGQAGESYEEIISESDFAGRPLPQTIHFSGEGEVRFVARSGTRLIRVTQALSPPSP